MVDGTRQHDGRNSRHVAMRAAEPFTAACGYKFHVTWRNNLAPWLLRHGDIHTSDTLDHIYETARRSTTWRT